MTSPPLARDRRAPQTNVAPSRRMIADLALVDAVSRSLLTAPDVDSARIDITASTGSVRLRGWISNHAERLAAVIHTRAVPGVTSVDNDLVVRDVDLATVGMTDDEIAATVGAALVRSTVRIDDLRFGVHQHVVELRGRVRSPQDAAAARDAVGHAPGVHFVTDGLVVDDDRRSERVDELEPRDCFRLLATHTLGRLATASPAGIDIFPVNYVLHAGEIYFRSGPGTKMIRLTASPHVTFEVDGRTRGRTWSVVVRGVARRLDCDDEIAASGIADAPSEHPSEKFNYVKIRPQEITGRRFAAVRQP